jgi:hypothetical protein
MAFSEGLSDTGDLTGRGSPFLRGAITGGGTCLGGIAHTLPFLIPQYRTALVVALPTIALELLTLAWIRWRLVDTSFVRELRVTPGLDERRAGQQGERGLLTDLVGYWLGVGALSAWPSPVVPRRSWCRVVVGVPPGPLRVRG